MSRNGYYGDYGSWQEEAEAYQEYLRKIEEGREPEVVPCFKCQSQMYQESIEPSNNICGECLQDTKQSNKEE